MIYTINLNVAIDKTAKIDKLELNTLNRLGEVITDAGGKGINVAKNLASFDIDNIVLGIMPKDGSDFIKQELDRLRIKYYISIISGRVRTNLKLIDKEGRLTEINEKGVAIDEDDLEAFTSRVQDLLKANDILILSGSLPTNVAKDYYAKLILMAKEKGAYTILDADGEVFKLALDSKPTIIKPNRYELIQYFNLDNNISNEELLNYAKTLVNEDTKIVVLSLGEDGAYFIRKNQIIKTEALKLDVKSTVGAGDSMVAAIAYAFYNRLPFTYLARLASASASASIIKEGTKAANIDLINHYLNKIEYQIIEN